MQSPRTDLRVLVASYLEPYLVDVIRAAAPEVEVVYRPELLPIPRYRSDHDGERPDLDVDQLKEWRELLATADVSFDFDWLDPSALRKNAPRLRWVQATSSGIGQFLNQHQLTESDDIVFTTAAGVHAAPLAEFTLLGLLYLVKDVPLLLARQQERHWQRYTTRSLAGMRVLVVGLGHVGRCISDLLTAADVEVWGGVRPGRPAPPSVQRAFDLPNLAQALPHVDAIVLSCPLTPETRGLIGKNELYAMPRGSLLVNVARGAVLDEDALVEALASGQLGGAALDVFVTEPLPTASPLWAMPNVLVSPHSASTLADENAAIVELFVDNLRRYRDGRPLRNVFSRDNSY
jgi:glyoxylate/hydroxypyruvate reductase A